MLATYPNSPTLQGALPGDISRFLVWEDPSGKTKVHNLNCKFIGEHGITFCSCPVRLSAGTVECIMQQLQKIFACIGRDGECNDFTQQGNSAVSQNLRQYLKFVKLEQAQAHVLPKQAKLILLRS